MVQVKDNDMRAADMILRVECVASITEPCKLAIRLPLITRMAQLLLRM